MLLKWKLLVCAVLLQAQAFCPFWPHANRESPPSSSLPTSPSFLLLFLPASLPLFLNFLR